VLGLSALLICGRNPEKLVLEAGGKQRQTSTIHLPVFWLMLPLSSTRIKLHLPGVKGLRAKDK
jgi:hypothetical protein